MVVTAKSAGFIVRKPSLAAVAWALVGKVTPALPFQVKAFLVPCAGMPLEASQVIGAVGGIGEIVRATFDSRDGKQ